MSDNQTKTKALATVKLVPGTFSKCYYCDVDNELCRKYNQPKNGWNEIGDWTWENYCLKNGGCDRFF